MGSITTSRTFDCNLFALDLYISVQATLSPLSDRSSFLIILYDKVYFLSSMLIYLSYLLPEINSECFILFIFYLRKALSFSLALLGV